MAVVESLVNGKDSVFGMRTYESLLKVNPYIYFQTVQKLYPIVAFSETTKSGVLDE